jgi:hypothetical protein
MAVADFVKAGGNVLALGLDEQEANAFLPLKVGMKTTEHLATFFEPAAINTAFAGIGPADVHNRAPRELPLLTEGAAILGDGVLAKAHNANVVFCQLPPYTVSRAEGVVPSFVVNGDDAAEGKQSGVLTLGAINGQGVQFGQSIKGGSIGVGKTYTFAAFVKALGGPLAAHLEIERSASPWDRAVKGEDVRVKENEWTELHVTFKVAKPFDEGWFAYLNCTQEGARFRVDLFRLYEGDYVPWASAGERLQTAPAGAPNLLTNPGFENGTADWRFAYHEQHNLRRTYRRTSFQLSRLLANMGVAAQTPLLARFSSPVTAAKAEKRWLDGFYLDQPEEWDDPYRFFRW